MSESTFSPLVHLWKPSHLSDEFPKAFSDMNITPIDSAVLSRVPMEIWQLIFCRLSIVGLHRMAFVCRQWRTWVDFDPIWKQICEKSFPDFNPNNNNNQTTTTTNCLIQSYRQLVLGHLYLLCDGCLEFSPGASPRIPLPVNHHLKSHSSSFLNHVQDPLNGDVIWMCRPCRDDYQTRYPIQSVGRITDASAAVYIMNPPKVRRLENNESLTTLQDEMFWNHEDCICKQCTTREEKCLISLRVSNDSMKGKEGLKKTKLNLYLARARKLLIKTKLEMVGLKFVDDVDDVVVDDDDEQVRTMNEKIAQNVAKEENKDKKTEQNEIQEENKDEKVDHDDKNDDNETKEKLEMKRYSDQDDMDIWVSEYINGVPYDPTKIVMTLKEKEWYEAETDFLNIWKVKKANRARSEALSNWISLFGERWQRGLIDWEDDKTFFEGRSCSFYCEDIRRFCSRPRMVRAFKACTVRRCRSENKLSSNSSSDTVLPTSSSLPLTLLPLKSVLPPPSSLWSSIEDGLKWYFRIADGRDGSFGTWWLYYEDLDGMWYGGRNVDCSFEPDALKDRLD